MCMKKDPFRVNVSQIFTAGFTKPVDCGLQSITIDNTQVQKHKSVLIALKLKIRSDNKKFMW